MLGFFFPALCLSGWHTSYISVDAETGPKSISVTYNKKKKQHKPKLSGISNGMKTTVYRVYSPRVVWYFVMGKDIQEPLKSLFLQQRDAISPDTPCCLQQMHLPLKALVMVYNSQDANCLAPCSHWTGIAILDWHCSIKFVPCVFHRVFNECGLPGRKAFGSTKQTKEQTFNQGI